MCVWILIYRDSPHLQEDLSELSSNLHQRVQVATVWGDAHGLEVVGFEFLLFPVSSESSEKIRQVRSVGLKEKATADSTSY